MRSGKEGRALRTFNKDLLYSINLLTKAGKEKLRVLYAITHDHIDRDVPVVVAEHNLTIFAYDNVKDW